MDETAVILVSHRYEIAIIDGTPMEARRIIIPESLQDEALKQLHLNYMGIEKTRMLTFEATYLVNINIDREEQLYIAPHALNSRQHDQRTKQCHQNTRETIGICRS